MMDVVLTISVAVVLVYFGMIILIARIDARIVLVRIIGV